jgi:hypothetical protein
MRYFAAITILTTVVLAGCGGKARPELHQVSGTVTYQGKPLPLGSVMFIPETNRGKAKTSPIDADGRYCLETVAGRYRVQIQMTGRLRSEPAPTGEGAQLDIPVVDWLIPEKYGHYQTSELKANVEAREGGNQIDFPLQ